MKLSYLVFLSMLGFSCKKTDERVSDSGHRGGEPPIVRADQCSNAQVISTLEYSKRVAFRSFDQITTQSRIDQTFVNQGKVVVNGVTTKQFYPLATHGYQSEVIDLRNESLFLRGVSALEDVYQLRSQGGGSNLIHYYSPDFGRKNLLQQDLKYRNHPNVLEVCAGETDQGSYLRLEISRDFVVFRIQTRTGLKLKNPHLGL